MNNDFLGNMLNTITYLLPRHRVSLERCENIGKG